MKATFSAFQLCGVVFVRGWLHHQGPLPLQQQTTFPNNHYIWRSEHSKDDKYRSRFHPMRNWWLLFYKKKLYELFQTQFILLIIFLLIDKVFKKYQAHSVIECDWRWKSQWHQVLKYQLSESCRLIFQHLIMSSSVLKFQSRWWLWGLMFSLIITFVTLKASHIE